MIGGVNMFTASVVCDICKSRLSYDHVGKRHIKRGAREAKEARLHTKPRIRGHETFRNRMDERNVSPHHARTC